MGGHRSDKILAACWAETKGYNDERMGKWGWTQEELGRVNMSKTHLMKLSKTNKKFLKKEFVTTF